MPDRTAQEALERMVRHQDCDSLERAEAAFHGMTDEQLDQPHGQSGRTRRQWLEGYRQNRREYEAARRLALAASDMQDALRQWSAAERTGDFGDRQNARRARDMVLAKLDGTPCPELTRDQSLENVPMWAAATTLHRNRTKVCLSCGPCTYEVEQVIYCDQDQGVVITGKLVRDPQMKLPLTE